MFPVAAVASVGCVTAAPAAYWPVAVKQLGPQRRGSGQLVRVLADTEGMVDLEMPVVFAGKKEEEIGTNHTAYCKWVVGFVE